MIQIIGLILLSVTTISINAQTKTFTDNCPTGQYVGFQSTAYQSQLSPVTVVGGIKYNTNGFYQTASTYTAAQSADQCCKACATQTDGVCTAWTYDGCNTCYLTSLSGGTSYLFSSANKYGCSSFVSGYIPKTTTPGSVSQPQTTTTIAYNCFSSTQTRSVSSTDIKVSATTLSDCCNACGNYAGQPKCFGFEFRTVDNSCWLKTYNPFADLNQIAGDGTIYTGYVTGVL